MTMDAAYDKIHYDAIIVGAGFSGMRMLHLLRNQGYSVRLIEAGDSVGGTWYWNRYPGARSDFPTEYYCYTGLDEVNKEWTWTAPYPDQSEILAYFNFVADKLDLRKDIQFNTRMTSATYDDSTKRWQVGTDDGERVSTRFLIPALGNVAVANWPEIDGLQDFAGEIYHTSQWPHEKVDLSGKRVAVIGTGSTGVQVITTIVDEVERLTVFQRTPQYVTPVSNPARTPEETDAIKQSYGDLKQRIRTNITGAGFELTRAYSALEDSPEERTSRTLLGSPLPGVRPRDSARCPRR
ncbi:flavin-containing monooxygenase [Rhodococcus pyridinivorans]|uniref:flavin-containing monooxygenase n=1 Tax=Rhodococcus pyridinivorans TaxID=103816 RepID=UPI0022835D9F|nr:NAD(P)/FAD-dependent oxidoreductase [Rhodococcus pyridinivorans]WAL49309.1 NAD(P)/FAD-dependent oxidoreductase [Rhodococcus pyridinivorans]